VHIFSKIVSMPTFASNLLTGYAGVKMC